MVECLDQSRKFVLVLFGFNFCNQFLHSLLFGHGSSSGCRSYAFPPRSDFLTRQFTHLLSVFMQSRSEFRENLWKVDGVRCYSLGAEFADAIIKATRWHAPPSATASKRRAIQCFG